MSTLGILPGISQDWLCGLVMGFGHGVGKGYRDGVFMEFHGGIPTGPYKAPFSLRLPQEPERNSQTGTL